MAQLLAKGSLGDVLRAIQQGTIDGTLGGMPIYTNMHFIGAGKYLTETNQSTLFISRSVRVVRLVA